MVAVSRIVAMRSGDQRRPRVGLGVGAAGRVEEDLREGHGRAGLEAIRMSGMIGAKLRLGRLDEARGVLDQELQLLREPPADDRVVLLEPHLQRLARQQLLLDEIGDHGLHLAGLGSRSHCLRQVSTSQRTSPSVTVTGSIVSGCPWSRSSQA